MIDTENYGKVNVCFLDVLGFKDLLQNNPHEYVVEIYASVFGAINNVLTDSSKTDTFIEENTKEAQIVSDSIIIYEKENSLRSVMRLLLYVQTTMTISIINGLPLRGAIAIGDLSKITTNNSISLIGNSIVKAYQLENTQNWSGCILHNDVHENLDKLLQNSGNSIDEGFLNYVLKDYMVPTKNKNEDWSFSIDWTKCMSPNKDGKMQGLLIEKEFVKKAFEDHNKPIINERVQEILMNTEKFWNYLNADNEFNDLKMTVKEWMTEINNTMHNK